jgi:hypothetical protein
MALSSINQAGGLAMWATLLIILSVIIAAAVVALGVQYIDRELRREEEREAAEL